MVVFVDLEHDAFNKHHYSISPNTFVHPFAEQRKAPSSKLRGAAPDSPARLGDEDVATNDDDPPADPMDGTTRPCPSQQAPNRNAFSAALSCYPYATLADQATIGSGSVLLC